MKNKYPIEQRYISNRLARSRQRINNVRFLVAHETANNTADADNHFTYFNNITFQASAHTFIDDKKILEIIPLTEKAWHVQYQKPIDNRMFGDDANDCAIGVELCRPGNFKKAYDRYVWYFAYLCHKYNLQPRKHIVSHKTLDPGRKFDPQSWLEPNGVSWEQFLNDVQSIFDEWEDEWTMEEKKRLAELEKEVKEMKKLPNWMYDSIVDVFDGIAPHLKKPQDWKRKLKARDVEVNELLGMFFLAYLNERK